MFLEMRVDGELKIIEKVLELAYTDLAVQEGAMGYFESTNEVNGLPTLSILKHLSPMQKAMQVPFIAAHSPAQLVPLVEQWLSAQDYGKRPSMGEDEKRGVRAYTEQFEWNVLVTFEPYWLIIGK